MLSQQNNFPYIALNFCRKVNERTELQYRKNLLKLLFEAILKDK